MQKCKTPNAEEKKKRGEKKGKKKKKKRKKKRGEKKRKKEKRKKKKKKRKRTLHIAVQLAHNLYAVGTAIRHLELGEVVVAVGVGVGRHVGRRIAAVNIRLQVGPQATAQGTLGVGRVEDAAPRPLLGRLDGRRRRRRRRVGGRRVLLGLRVVDGELGRVGRWDLRRRRRRRRAGTVGRWRRRWRRRRVHVLWRSTGARRWRLAAPRRPVDGIRDGRQAEGTHRGEPNDKALLLGL